VLKRAEKLLQFLIDVVVSAIINWRGLRINKVARLTQDKE